MTALERVARIEHRLRPWVVKLPPGLATKIFSRGRTWFAHRLETEAPSHQSIVSEPVRAWNLTFRMPVWNAAGMFKEGGGFDAMFAQGAGALLVGTTTSEAREGNVRNGVQWPAVPYPESRSASNWMGLPNPGHIAVATRISRMPRETGFPIGASLAADPLMDEDLAMKGLLNGFNAYSLAKADYLELNESCPNVPGAHSADLDRGLMRRLEIVSEKFLKSRHRPLPVVVKISNDVADEQLPSLLQTLVELGYDGVVLGNTSTQYAELRRKIKSSETALYDSFTSTYGGGLSGAVLTQRSLQLVTQAARILSAMTVPQEFHIIRCGGVFTGSDVLASMEQGVVLHQWYTGYFEGFARYGHGVYQRLSKSIAPFFMESSRTDTLS